MNKVYVLGCGLIMCVALIFTNGCKKNDDSNSTTTPTTPPPAATAPVLTTTAAGSITQTSASSGGNVSSDGGATVTARGVCWSTSASPTVSNSKTSDGTGTGSFSSTISGLTANTTYYVRAYATNSAGTSYGSQASFTTLTSITLTIGQTYEGGIVFYIDGTGQHGLVAAPADQGTVHWGCQGTNVSGTSTALGTGLANTIAIVNQCSTAGIAARICFDLVLNGKSDWYLPSKDELDLLHQNLYLAGIGNLQLNRYWSSSQYNSQNAWCQLFNLNLNQLYYDKDLIAYPIRAIRSF